MARLTHERMDGTGFASQVQKEKIVQRLGQIEHGYVPILEQVCDQLCKHYDIDKDQEELDEFCERCPLNILENLILEG